MSDSHAALSEEIVRLRAEVKKLEAALRDQISRWESVPSGADLDADPNDTSPDDAVAHMAGLAIRAAEAVLDHFPDHGKG